MKSPCHGDWAGNTSWEHPLMLEGRGFGSGSVKMVLTRRMCDPGSRKEPGK